jgi:hypothetical protein
MVQDSSAPQLKEKLHYMSLDGGEQVSFNNFNFTTGFRHENSSTRVTSPFKQACCSAITMFPSEEASTVEL